MQLVEALVLSLPVTRLTQFDANGFALSQNACALAYTNKVDSVHVTLLLKFSQVSLSQSRSSFELSVSGVVSNALMHALTYKLFIDPAFQLEV